MPKSPDSHFEQERIQKTLAYLATVPAAALDGTEDGQLDAVPAQASDAHDKI